MKDISVKTVYEIPLEEEMENAVTELERPQPERPQVSYTLNKQKLSEALMRVLKSMERGYSTFSTFNVREKIMDLVSRDIVPSFLYGKEEEDLQAVYRLKKDGFLEIDGSQLTFTKRLLNLSGEELKEELSSLADEVLEVSSPEVNTLDKQKLNDLLTHIFGLLPKKQETYHFGPEEHISKKLIPYNFPNSEMEDLEAIFHLIDRGYLDYNSSGFVITERLTNLGDEELKKELSVLADRVMDAPPSKVTPPSSEKTPAPEGVIDALLKADFIRADITPENRRKLENPNSGVWELWELLQRSSDNQETLKLDAPVYARPPKLDVARNDTIGIDFGTKSTVVARITGGKIDLFRVGTGDYRSEISQKQYENPTILQFIDLDRFQLDFYSREGRPMTRWMDVNTSHTAMEARNGLSGNDGPIYLSSFFGELKQWASGSRLNIHIMDRRSIDEKRPPKELKPFLTLPEDEQDNDEAQAINPIVYYAYYIGLYINNMRVGKIYLKYLLSFPVSYSKASRKKILRAFELGLRKSLPESILRDEDCMNDFYVREGAAEPAAYSVCALKKFGLVPRQGERIYFAVFDFGGGTSDFDLGIWRRAEGKEGRRGVRFVIEHLANGGAEYLGGENILWEMAYRTFCENADTLRNEGVQFSCPPWIIPEPGFEFLIDDTLEAQTNIRTLSELLRPVWENGLQGNAESGYFIESGSGGGYDFDVDGIARLPLSDENGQRKPLDIRIPVEDLLRLIRLRIEAGVTQFLDMVKSFAAHMSVDEGNNSPVINVFLAGNSSQSDIFQEIITKKIEALNAEMRNIWGENHRGDPPDSFFEIFDPLGSEAAEKRLGGQGDSDRELKNCTGKTGVAIGLLLARSGSNIKVIDRTLSKEEIPFRFWIGDMDDCDHLHPFLTPKSEYGVWVEYWDASEESFDFYYTSSPTAGMESGVPIEETKSRQFLIPREYVCADWNIYLRPISPNEIECAVAESPTAIKEGAAWLSGTVKLD